MRPEVRNVLIVGKVGSGKRTIGNAILDGVKQFDEDRTHSVLGTRNAGSFFCEGTKGDFHYRVLTVDTESTQKSFIDPIPEMKRHKFEQVNLIIFAIPFGRYTGESHTSVQYVAEGLSESAKSICALIITNCAGQTDQAKSSAVNEFKTNPRAMILSSCMKKGIFTVSFAKMTNLTLREAHSAEINSDKQKIKLMVDQSDSTLKIENTWIQRPSRQPYQRPAVFPAPSEPPPNQMREQAPTTSLIAHRHNPGRANRRPELPIIGAVRRCCQWICRCFDIYSD